MEDICTSPSVWKDAYLIDHENKSNNIIKFSHKAKKGQVLLGDTNYSTFYNGNGMLAFINTQNNNDILLLFARGDFGKKWSEVRGASYKKNSNLSLNTPDVRSTYANTNNSTNEPNSIGSYHSDCYGVSKKVKNLLEENTYDQFIYGRLRFARDAKDTIGACNHPLALQATDDIDSFVKIGSEVRNSTNNTLTNLAANNIAKAREEKRVFTLGNVLNAFGKLSVDSAQTSRADEAVKRHGKSIKALMDAKL